MPVLVFNDGKRGKVPYDLGAKIYQILNNNAKAIAEATEEQIDYANRVSEVIFDEPKKSSKQVIQKGALAKAVDDVMGLKHLNGRQKFLEIKRRFKGEE